MSLFAPPDAHVHVYIVVLLCEGFCRAILIVVGIIVTESLRSISIINHAFFESIIPQ